MEAPTEEEGLWLSAPLDEVATGSGLFGAFGGVAGEKTGCTAFMANEGPVRTLRRQNHISGGLASMIRAPTMVAMIHYMRLFLAALFTPKWSRATAP